LHLKLGMANSDIINNLQPVYWKPEAEYHVLARGWM